jgi:hypothetical protein
MEVEEEFGDEFLPHNKSSRFNNLTSSQRQKPITNPPYPIPNQLLLFFYIHKAHGENSAK